MNTKAIRSRAAVLVWAPCAALAQTAEPPVADGVLPEVRSVARDAAPSKARESAAGGALGTRALIDTPYSVNVITRELIDDQQARLLTEVLRTEASATPSFGSGYHSYQGITLRGFGLSNTVNYRRDGLPFTHLSETPFENVERVEVLKGLSGFLYGFAQPGGIVNVVPKKPTAQPYAAVRAGITSQSLGLLHADLGGRFGEADRFGYRVNLAREEGETAIDDVNIGRTLASVYLDWRATPDLLFAFDFESHRIKPRGQPLYYALAPGLPVPAAPDLSRFNGVRYAGYETRDRILGLRADWAFAPDWALSLGVTDHDHARDAWFPNARITNAAGDMTVTIQRDALQSYPNRSAQAVLTGKAAFAGLQHELTAGFNWNTNEGYRGDYISAPTYASNLYAPVEAPRTDIYALRPEYRSATYRERGFFVSDTVALGSQWQLIAGLRHAQLSTRSFRPDGTLNPPPYDKSALTPSIAAVFKPRGNVALYASYVEGLEQGGTAPAGTPFEPLESRQIEAGAKWDVDPAFGVTAAVFHIDKGLGYTDTRTTPGTYVQSGSQLHRGLELAANGRLGAGLDIAAGWMWLHARARDTGNAAVDGKRPINVPTSSATAHLRWRVPGVAGLALDGGVQYVSGRAADEINTRFIDGYSLLRAGASHESKLIGQRTVLRLGIDNLTDRRYWAAASPQLYAGLPRTVKLALDVQF